MAEQKPEKKPRTRKYLLGLGAAFLFGLGLGTKYSEEIKYIFWKSEKIAISTDQALEKHMPKPVIDYDKAIRRTLYGWTEEEVKQKQSQLISELDEKIRKYEQKTE